MIEQKHFESLIQIQRLESLIRDHQKEISNHSSRITKIENLRLQKQNDQLNGCKRIEELQTSIDHEEQHLEKIIKQLQQSEANARLVTSEAQATAIERELTQLNIQKEKLEQIILEFLEEQELATNESEEIESFLSGSIESLSEISAEVERDIEEEDNQILILKQRIDNLFDTCPKEMKLAYSDSSKRFAESPLAFIKGQNCNKCFFAIERNLESQVERASVLEYCPGCGRLLAPTLVVQVN